MTTIEQDGGMFGSRKFVLTLIAVGVVLLIWVGTGLLKKYAGIDITEAAKWAMITIVTGAGLGSGTIAYEDSRKAAAANQ